MKTASCPTPDPPKDGKSHPAVALFDQSILREINHLLKLYLGGHTNEENYELAKSSRVRLAELARLNPSADVVNDALLWKTPCRSDLDITEAGAWTSEQVLNMPRQLDDHDLIVQNATNPSLNTATNLITTAPTIWENKMRVNATKHLPDATGPLNIAVPNIERVDLESGSALEGREASTNGKVAFTYNNPLRASYGVGRVTHFRPSTAGLRVMAFVLIATIICQSILTLLTAYIPDICPHHLESAEYPGLTCISHVIRNVGSLCLLFIFFVHELAGAESEPHPSQLRVALATSIILHACSLFSSFCQNSLHAKLLFSVSEISMLLVIEVFCLRLLRLRR